MLAVEPDIMPSQSKLFFWAPNTHDTIRKRRQTALLAATLRCRCDVESRNGGRLALATFRSGDPPSTGRLRARARK